MFAFLASLVSVIFAQAPPSPPAPAPWPFPEDCSTFNGTSEPLWFNGTECQKAPGGCFLLDVPNELVGSKYTVGNASRTFCDQYGNCTTDHGHDTRWCVDHINGKVYTKGLLKNDSTMYFEADNKTGTANCRFVVGWDFEQNETHVRTYQEDGLSCTTTKGTTTNNITFYTVEVDLKATKELDIKG